MLVDPHDLIEGRSASVSLSAQAAPAVARLLVGQPASAQGTGNLTTGANSPPVQPTSQQPATAQ
ncbi:MAG TPA: hypothetical protein VMB34_21725 [Acetobacteraceae bacterium]|nr:hypothetical protein [Acetobacteraceae bacterium]